MISLLRSLLSLRPLACCTALVATFALAGLASPAGAQDNQPFKAGLVSVDYDASTSTATVEVRVKPDQAFENGTLTGLQLTLRAPEESNTQFGDVVSSPFGLQRATGDNDSGVQDGFKYQFYSAGASGAAEDFLAGQEKTLATIEVEGDKSNVIELAIASYAESLPLELPSGGIYFLAYDGVQYFNSNNSTPANEFYKTISSGLNPGETTLRSVHQVTVEGTDGTGNADDIGWRLLAAPSDATRADLEDDVSFDVDEGFLMYTWAGGEPDAWNPVTGSSSALPRGQGYLLYFFDDSVDPLHAEGFYLDVPDEGEDQTDDFTVDGLNQDHKFHLLGNPYDVAFDLGSLAGGDLPGKGFQNTVQVWDPTGIGEWKTITQGDPDDNVAAWQGLFVEREETGSGQTSLTFDADGRQSGPGDLIGSPSQPLATTMDTTTEGQARKTTEGQAQVELALTVESNADTVAQEGVTLFLHDEASAGWDAYEASQLSPPNSAAYATVNSPLQRDGDLDRRALASEPFPTGNASATVPLSVRSVGVAGTATLRWPESERGGLPSEWGVQLVDTATGTTADLRDGSYSFELEDGDGTISDPDDARFELSVGPSAIPVELARFKAQSAEGTARLTWQTASETNNAGFYVQRKMRGGSWTRLGFVESKAQGGTTSEPKSYRFRDADLPYTADSLAYRLRQVDTDGAAHLSDEQVVQRGVPSQVELKPPAPNPAPQRATIWFAVPKATQVRVSVYDLLGRQVATVADSRFEAGRHEETVRTAPLAPGAYFVRLQTDQKVRTRRLTVVR